MYRVTVKYKPFEDADFTDKTCSILEAPTPNKATSIKAPVCSTNIPESIFQNQHDDPEYITFTVEFVPFITGKHLVKKACDLVAAVRSSDYKPATFMHFVHKEDGSIGEPITVNDTFIQKAEYFLNRKNEATGEMGYIRIRFTLQGLPENKK